MDKNTEREAARKEILEGIKNGFIKVKVVHKCSWCNRKFKTENEYESHLVDGKFINKNTGELNRICPF